MSNNPITPVCWVNGAFRSPQEAHISAFDHGLLYGDGIFEGIRFYNKKAFLLEQHLKRLEDSAQALCLTLPYTRSQWIDIIQQVIEAYGAKEGYIRLVVTRGEGNLGIDPGSCQKASAIVIVDRIHFLSEEKRQRGIETMITSVQRMSNTALDPRIKSLNYLNNVLALMDAKRHGMDEAIMLNPQGYVCEGSGDNIFIAKDSRLITPPGSDGTLAGITRDFIITLAEQAGIETEMRSLRPYDLYVANECFLCGTGAELIPVRAIDGREMQTCPGPLYERIRQAFSQAIQ